VHFSVPMAIDWLAGGNEQGIKKGIVEMADMILVNKADGELLPSARKAQAEYTSALKLLRPRFANWTPQVLGLSAHVAHAHLPRTHSAAQWMQVLQVSAQTGHGIDAAWTTCLGFRDALNASGSFHAQREQQQRSRMWALIQNRLLETCVHSAPRWRCTYSCGHCFGSFRAWGPVRSRLDDLEAQVAAGFMTPSRAADILTTHFAESLGRQP
jgi:LAO/AO transport system kinase